MLAMNTSAVDVKYFHKDPVIDEVSPSEDEHFMELVIHGHSEFRPCFIIQAHLLFNEVSQMSIQILLVLYHSTLSCLLPHNIDLYFVLHKVLILLRRCRGCCSSIPSVEPYPSPT